MTSHNTIPERTAYLDIESGGLRAYDKAGVWAA